MVLGEVSGREVRIEGFGDGEVLEGFRGAIVESQRLVVKLDEAGIFGPDLGTMKELGIEMRGWKAFLEEKRENGELQG
jgi:hypothetical protein